MVKLFASAIAAVALLQGACAHMLVDSPPPRSGVVANELIAPCGGANEVTKNITTFAVSGDSEFVLRPGHDSGELIFNYFTDLTVTNSSKAFPLKTVPVPKPDTYTTTLDFSDAKLKSDQQIVVQAIYKATTDTGTEEYYVCFDVKLAEKAESASNSETSESDGESGLDSGSDSDTSAASSFAASTIGAALGLLAVAAAF
ncbi:hypothetical protein H4S02_006232 [Coemansia sp. RSA 2611]|nr:hypothetical protein H4S02_006232 [Coemansia sp. RSA 2611]